MRLLSKLIEMTRHQKLTWAGDTADLLQVRVQRSPLKQQTNKERVNPWITYCSDTSKRETSGKALTPALGRCRHRGVISLLKETEQKPRLPRWHSGKEFAWRCRRHKKHGFNPWVWKMLWRRKWQPIPVFLPRKSHGQRSLESCSQWGRKGSGRTEWLSLNKRPCSFKEPGGIRWMEGEAEGLRVGKPWDWVRVGNNDFILPENQKTNACLFQVAPRRLEWLVLLVSRGGVNFHWPIVAEVITVHPHPSASRCRWVRICPILSGSSESWRLNSSQEKLRPRHFLMVPLCWAPGEGSGEYSCLLRNGLSVLCNPGGVTGFYSYLLFKIFIW